MRWYQIELISLLSISKSKHSIVMRKHSIVNDIIPLRGYIIISISLLFVMKEMESECCFSNKQVKP